jgi:hypothetical protein
MVPVVATGRPFGGRRGRSATVVVGLIVAFATLTACQSNLNLPSDRSWQSTHFDYRTRASDISVCPDILGPLEDHFAVLQGYLGFDWPVGKRVTYYKFLDSADFSANADCGTGAGGCAFGPDVRSTNGLDTHELVHAYLAESGFPPSILVEGVAVVLSCTADSYASPKPTQTWDQLAAVEFSASDTTTVYATGAWLVGYLLDAFGPERFLTLYRTLPPTAGAAKMDAAVQNIYGQSLSAIWTAALSQSQPRNSCVWQCSRPEIALDGVAFDTSAGVCGVDVERTFAIASESVISFLAKGSAFGLGPCGQSDPPRIVLNGGLTGGLLAFYDLPAGSYYLEYSPVPGTMTPTGDASSALNPVCASSTDVAALSAPTMLVAVPPSSPNWFLPLPPPLADGKPPLIQSVQTATNASLCASCDPTSCVDASKAGAWTSGTVINLETDPTKPFSQFIFSWY